MGVTESELDESARLAVFSQPADFDDSWGPEMLVPASRDRRAMHSLDTADLDGDGRPDIVGKSYRANWVNGVDGKNQADVCWNETSE